MRLLLRSNTSNFQLTKDLVGHDLIPPYAILSHTWGLDKEEVTFEDIVNGTGQKKLGYKKIRFCEEQARQDGLQYFWIDTCCINKENDAELSRSINSMFRWYRNATRCYVYLSDVSATSISSNGTNMSTKPWELDFRKSRWFTRGWTLQELLAPVSVEFFSREGKKLGERSSLRQKIHEITNISYSALQGDCLSQFSVEERLRWIEHRQTKLEEDRAYSLLGIFGVYILPIYGEGMASALARLLDEFHKVQKCIQDLRLTDPRDDKKRIEDTKGGLIVDSYCWILENPDFRRWRNDQRSRLLWIKGDPGKGKTMLLCGIINELNESVAKTHQLSYFFCQAMDSRINSATAVLRGLLYSLVTQQPSLVSHLRKKYDQAGQSVFEDANAWVALSDILADMIQDPDLEMACLVVDALDECVADLPKLLDFVIRTSTLSARVKWLLSSRNEMHIEQKLRGIDARARLSLELKENAEQVSRAVDVYIKNKLSRLHSLQDDSLRDQVRDILRWKANGTFLWVALVVQELEGPESWNPLQVVEEAPPGLHQLYDRMMNQIHQRKRDSEVCQLLLSTACLAYRPLYLAEMGSLCGLSGLVSVLARSVRTIAAMCGSFLTVRDDQVYLIHQSAKDYLSDKMRDTIFPSQGRIHHNIFSRSLKLLSNTLKRNMYNLSALDFPINKVEVPADNPLATIQYSCVHWVDHLCDWNSSSANHGINSQDKNAIEDFIKKKYLYWLEALSLCRSMSEGVLAIVKLSAFAQRQLHALSFINLLQDARLLIMHHIQAIQNSPLQIYVSALLFSPEHNLIRNWFKKEEPKWITVKPVIGQWSACLQTLEGHSSSVGSVAFSPDSTRLASGSVDKTIKIWDASSGACLQTLEGHSDWVGSVAFSPDSTRLASGSDDETIKIWDASSGACLQTLEGHSSSVGSVAFSPDSTRLASGSVDETIKIWDASSGACLQTLEGHSSWVGSVAFSPDSTRLASGSVDKTIKIWDTSSGACLQTLEGHSRSVRSVAFSPNSTRLASGSVDKTIKIWDASSGACLQTLEGHSDWVRSVAFSPDSTRLASGSVDETIKIWDASSGACLQTLEGHSSWVGSVAFSPDSTRLASGSVDKTIKIWDASSGACLQTLEGHSDLVTSVAFSPDSTRLASGSVDETIKIWDASSGACLQTLEGHSDLVRSVAFSPDSTRLASGSGDKTIKIWDASSGACLQTLEGHSSWVGSVAFSPDSTRLASGSGDETIKIWDTSSGACLQTLEGHSDSVASVAFSPDSTRLASGSDDETIKIWDASSGACLQTLEGHSDWVRSVAFSPDSTRLASGSDVKTDYQGLGISLDRIWMCYNSENILWLPFEYRPSCVTASKNQIGIGTRHGKVWICSVEGNKR